MKHPPAVWIAFFCLLPGLAGAQIPSAAPSKGNWDIVENLSPGTLISVRISLSDHNSHTVRCTVDAVDEAQIVCSRWTRPVPRPYPVYQSSSPEYAFPREQVLLVRLENDDFQVAQSSLTGAVAGAALAGVIGYNCCRSPGATPPQARAAAASLAGAIAGGVLGRIFPFVRGRVIYRR